MKFVEPKVVLVAESKLDDEGLTEYLEDIGAGEYETDKDITDLEELVKVAGKACYKSFVPGLNPNVTKVRNDSGKYIDNINKIGHGSVNEHAWVTFIFWNVSRVFTHELVRHRVGTAMSQESLRYVRLDDLGFWIPPRIDENEEARDLFISHVRRSEELQRELAELYDIENMTNFKEKKKLTSAFRRVAPIGLGTAIVWSMNLRSARHLLQLRTYPDAEVEIRKVFDEVGKILTDKYPLMFNDFTRTEHEGIGTWICGNAAMPYDNVKIRELEKRIKKLEADNKSLREQVGSELRGAWETTEQEA